MEESYDRPAVPHSLLDRARRACAHHSVPGRASEVGSTQLRLLLHGEEDTRAQLPGSQGLPAHSAGSDRMGGPVISDQGFSELCASPAGHPDPHRLLAGDSLSPLLRQLPVGIPEQELLSLKRQSLPSSPTTSITSFADFFYYTGVEYYVLIIDKTSLFLLRYETISSHIDFSDMAVLRPIPLCHHGYVQ